MTRRVGTSRNRLTTGKAGHWSQPTLINTTKSASYTGCGCAGGEMLMLTDEVNRQQKVYSDILGRQWKREILNSNGSVYSTTTNTLNARDQIAQVRQTDNATG